MKEYFSIENLLKSFTCKEDAIQSSTSAGVDGINGSLFASMIDQEIEIIHRKVLNHTYSFSNYKQTLFIKGVNKTRTIAISTQRDKFVLQS